MKNPRTGKLNPDREGSFTARLLNSYFRFSKKNPKKVGLIAATLFVLYVLLLAVRK